MASVAYIMWLQTSDTKWPTTIFRFVSEPSLNFLLKRRFPLLIFTTDFSVCMEMCAWVLVVLDDG